MEILTGTIWSHCTINGKNIRISFVIIFNSEAFANRTAGEYRKDFTYSLNRSQNNFSLPGIRPICPLDYLLLQICRWPVNNTSSGYHIITKGRRRGKVKEVRVIIFVKGSSEIKKNNLEACALNWSRTSSLGALLRAASEVGKGQKADKKDSRREMQGKPVRHRGFGEKGNERGKKITRDSGGS